MKQLKTKSLTGYDVIDRALVANLQLTDKIDGSRLINHISGLPGSDRKQILINCYQARELITVPGGLISKNSDWYLAPNFYFYTKTIPYYNEPDLETVKLYQKNEWNLLVARHLAPITMCLLITMALKLYGLVTNPLVLMAIPLIVILGTALYLPNFKIKSSQELDQIRRVMDPYGHTSFFVDDESLVYGESLYPGLIGKIMNHGWFEDDN